MGATRPVTTADADSTVETADLPFGQVLVADDQPDVLEALRLLLKLNGFSVETRSSPAGVIDALADGGSRRYDLLVMDLNYARDTTSGREGLELVEQVRAVDATLPIVVMTAWSTVPLAVSIMRNGVSDFVEKPWDNNRLLATVRSQVASGRQLRRIQRLESDARDVQRRLLSRAVPDVPGYEVGVAWRFAEQLGGDAYEVAPLPSGRLGVAIGDVCGKGTPAALLMASAHATLRDLMALPIPPHEACARLDDALSTRLGPERFVSLAYAVLDQRAGTLAYANAGHPPPVLLAADGSVRRLEVGGPVLGMIPNARFEQGEAPLAAGSRLVLYTDGVVEAASAGGGEMGDERLVAALAGMRGLGARETARAVLDHAVRYAGGGPLADDATVVVVDVSQGGRP
jgi:sigma-B regulation protein RsbU (phosphoserine phosphatase)